MKKVGHVAELWRYPISSLGGEKCETSSVNTRGIAGDRAFGIYETATGQVAAPEKEPRWRPALFLHSTMDDGGLARIHFPDGTALSVIDAAAPSRLSQHFGFDVGIGRYQHVDTPLASALQVISNRYEPSPLHLVTTQSLTALAELASLDEMDHRRFRPSVLISTQETPASDAENSGFLEERWLGGTLQIGDVKATVSEKSKRCGMTFIAQPNLNEQPEILRTLVRRNARNFGVYCDIVRAGTLTVGANVYL